MLNKLKSKYDLYSIKRIAIKYGANAGVNLSDITIDVSSFNGQRGAKACASCDIYTNDETGELERVNNFKITVHEEMVSGLHSKDVIENIIGHEVAHMLLYKLGKFKEQHSETFILKCLEIGVDEEYAEACPRLKVQGNPLLLRKYDYRKIQCKGCGMEVEKTNSPSRANDITRNYKCGKCGDKLINKKL